jgi:general secretion pathway protein G
MSNSMWSRLREEEGFTLVETLVVITILGVLASVAVIGVSSTTADSKTAACKSEFATLQAAADNYFAKNGAWPSGSTSGDRITALVSASMLRTAPDSSSGLSLAADGTVSSTVSGCTP